MFIPKNRKITGNDILLHLSGPLFVFSAFLQRSIECAVLCTYKFNASLQKIYYPFPIDLMAINTASSGVLAISTTTRLRLSINSPANLSLHPPVFSIVIMGILA